MDTKKLKAAKILTVILSLLSVAVIITGYYAYRQSRMSQMYKYSQQATKTLEEAKALFHEA